MKDLTHPTREQEQHIWWWPGVVLLTILLLAGCGASSATSTSAASAPSATASAGSAQVKVTEQSEKYGFSPAMLSVAVGTKVVWTNSTDVPHTVTSDTGSTLASSMISPSGGTFSFTFTKPGTYTYHCTIHPYMKGTIVVTG